MKTTAILFTITILCSLALAHYSNAPLYTHKDGRRSPIVPCATQEVYDAKLTLGERLNVGSAACATKGSCDTVSVRDSTDTTSVMQLRVQPTIIGGANNVLPDDLTEANITAMLDNMNDRFAAYGIQLLYQELRISQYNPDGGIFGNPGVNPYCIPGYSSDGAWLTALEAMKEATAFDADTAMQIWISCMDFSLQGTLFGVGTFPWDNTAVSDKGGLFLNSITCTYEAQEEDNDTTHVHEMGHCLGLWHTFHGSDEVVGCNLACEEEPHGFPDPEANTVGDFCSDTPATPRNYECEDPPGDDSCTNTPWGNTEYGNYMGYSMGCGSFFSDQQVLRMRCWICDELGDYVDNYSTVC